MGLTSKLETIHLNSSLFHKTDIPAVLKDIKEIPMGYLILTAYKSRKSGQLSVPRRIYLASTILTF